MASFCFLYIAAGTRELYSNLLVAIKLVKNNTCIRFNQVTASNQIPDHLVHFFNGTERYGVNIMQLIISYNTF